jgi:hypothetical protein
VWYSLYTVPTVPKRESTLRLNLDAHLFFQLLNSCLTCLIVVSALVFQKAGLLSSEVNTECDSRDAEAGEGALEAVEAGERTGVSPLLAVNM